MLLRYSIIIFAGTAALKKTIYEREQIVLVYQRVSNSALNGHLTANPLNLRHFDLSEIALSVV